MALIQEYFELSNKYQQEYGTNTILLMQVGSFFEVYGNKTQRSIDDFTRICELNIADKGTSQMAGFKDMQLEKYLKKIQESGYTAVVYVQDETKTNRKLAGVFSPGTYFSDSPVLSNHITCVWVDQVNRLFPKGKCLVVGVASIDIYTGKSSMMEYTEEYLMNPTTFDELERFISITNPSEVIFISNLGSEIDKMIHYAGIQCDLIHRIPITKEDTVIMKRVRNCEKQTYQHEILKTPNDSPIATQAYCYLYDFVYQHNPHLMPLTEPEWQHPNRLVLANHTLKQLNIIDDGAVKPNKLSCISSMLNDCSTPMGKRAFLHLLLNPICDPVVLQREYDITEHVMDKTISLTVKDLSKWERKLFLKKATIGSFVTLKQDMETVLRHSDVDSIILTYLRNFDVNMDKVSSYSEEILHFIHSHFDITTETIQSGVDVEYDRQRTKLEEAEKNLYKIQEQFNELLEKKEKKKSEYVKIHETEKNSIGLICTKRRASLLMTMVTLSLEVQSGSNVYLINPEIQTLCKTITTLRTTIEKEKERVFWMIVERMEAYQSKLDTIILFITRLDLIYTRASIAKKYKYCKPTLVHSSKSFVDAKQLRHALIEQLQNELYVTNDITLGTGVDGILLYGTNAVGKTSFIRALGIAVILAQAGMYVPCSSFHYKPYQSLFTRIIGNDNLFKGLSTFAVEMSELRTILKLANQNSLILGDELCSGTETQSAISIFVAGIQHFHREKSSFLFATHLHEIVDYDELQLDTVKLKHMSVVYDKASGVLVYDRKLKDGPGDNMYGLEVCKSLSLPSDFLTTAYAIREKYAPTSILSLKTSRYNSKKLVGACEQCGKKGKEIHHLQYQEDAVDGFITTEDSVFPKHHVANLMTLCEKCHDRIHQTKTRLKKVKTSKGITHVNV